MKTVNIGVIGLGFMGMVHLRSYLKIPGARIAALADAAKNPVDGKLPGVGGNITDTDAFPLDPETKFYESWRDLIADPDIDLVDICLPTAAHVEVSIAALQAGKHVICEKPMARTSADCRKIVEAAAASPGHFMPAMCMRFWPGWDWLKQAIDEQPYGKLLAARFRRVSAPPGWSRGNYFKGGESGGALFDLHIHDTDFIQYALGRPKSVASTGITRFSGAIDHIVTSYEVECGAVVTAEGSWMMTEGYPFTMVYTANFERATAEFDISRKADALKLYEEGKEPVVVPPSEGDGYVNELRHLVEAVQSGTAPSVVTAADGLSAVEICEAEEASAASGQRVVL
jgi:predicted dehydrogenase